MIKPLLIILSLFITSIALAEEKVCAHIYVSGSKRSLDFTDTEKKLMCGDKKLEGYKDIPNYQASFYLTGFLQARGYLEPKFKTTEDDILHVKVGKKTFVRKVKVISELKKEKKYVKSEIRRLFSGRLLTTDLLNSIEAEALGIVRTRGYPCAKVSSEVNSKNGTVTIVLGRMAFFNFGKIDIEQIDGLHDNALERHYPFNSDMPFNADLLKLNEKRMTRTEVVQGAYFLESCSEDLKTFGMEQKFIVGPPRTIRFGAGASTEVGPMAQAKWANNRMGPMASLLSATVQASFRQQSFNVTADSYIWGNHARQSILSQAQVTRESQYDYKQTLYSVSSQMKWTKDIGNHLGTYTIGPKLEAGVYNTIENNDTKSVATGIILGSAVWTSHPYELFDLHPEDGNTFGVNFDFRHPSMGFVEPLLKLDSTFANLTRLGNSGRGTLIGGIRLNAGTTWVNHDVSLNGLPPTVKFYGGGSDDIRGYLLKTLPRNDGQGALTRLGMKLELRRTYVWKESLEAFGFVDSGLFGDQSWNVKNQIWYSPGLGLRWLSPIGLIQTYAARALSWNPGEDNGNFFYAGFGGVF